MYAVHNTTKVAKFSIKYDNLSSYERRKNAIYAKQTRIIQPFLYNSSMLHDIHVCEHRRVQKVSKLSKSAFNVPSFINNMEFYSVGSFFSGYISKQLVFTLEINHYKMVENPIITTFFLQNTTYVMLHCIFTNSYRVFWFS